MTQLVDSDRLDSWREIAVFINRDARTAMRWAKYYGMPVHHAPGGSHARVFAYRSEVLKWVQLQDHAGKMPHSAPATSGHAGPPVPALSAAPTSEARIAHKTAASEISKARPGFFDYLGNRRWLIGLVVALLAALLLLGKLFVLR